MFIYRRPKKLEEYFMDDRKKKVSLGDVIKPSNCDENDHNYALYLALREAVISVAGQDAAIAMERLAEERYNLKLPNKNFGHLKLGFNGISREIRKNLINLE
jgi:hypothetical protein